MSKSYRNVTLLPRWGKSKPLSWKEILAELEEDEFVEDSYSITADFEEERIKDRARVRHN